MPKGWEFTLTEEHFRRIGRIETKYLVFQHSGDSDSGKTMLISVLSLDETVLGLIKWHAPWRKYCFAPNASLFTIYDANCLDMIGAFLERMTEWHKEKNASAS